MPIPDLGPRLPSAERLRIARDKAFVRRMAERLGRERKRPGDAAGDGAPVAPNRPDDSSGGAAAALEFDE